MIIIILLLQSLLNATCLFPHNRVKHSKFHEHLQESLSLLGKFSPKAFVENERINLNIRILAQLEVPTINFLNFKYRKAFPVKKIEVYYVLISVQNIVAQKNPLNQNFK